MLPVDDSLLLLLIDNDVVMAALKDINLEFSAQSLNCQQNRFHLGTTRDIDDVSAVAYLPEHHLTAMQPASKAVFMMLLFRYVVVKPIRHDCA